MSFLELHNLNKTYFIHEQEKRYALANFSIVLPSSGLVAINGKSGSGKSTLLNMVGLLDRPDSGNIYLNNHDITRFKSQRKRQYRNKDSGIIFQHYHLLEKESVLFNIMLPMLISGEKYKSAKEDALLLLEGINFSSNFYERKCCNLSGGEKQRVAILRSLINNPKIVLADEPTGALDSQNSHIVMKMLKNASQTRLVLLVSHNNELVRQYADRIITIKDGRLIDNKIIIEENNGTPLVKERTKKTNNVWINKITKTNFLGRRKRNIIAISSLIIGLSSSMLIVGFSNGASNSINHETMKHFDYGSLTLSKEIKKDIEGSPLSLVQTLRPSKNEIKEISPLLMNYYIEQNYDALLANITFSADDNILDNFSYVPVYSFVENVFDKSLIISGRLPSQDNIGEVIVNEKAWELLEKKQTSAISVTSTFDYHYYADDEIHPSISDHFVYEKNLAILGVCEELDFLATPKIYYSYRALHDYLSLLDLPNLSNYLHREITWSDAVIASGDTESLSSYSYRLFMKDISHIKAIQNDIDLLEEPLKITCPSLIISNALLNLIHAATAGMEVFLILVLMGTALILGIITFASYSEDKKQSAILSCLGASKEDLINLYLNESTIVGLISLSIAFILSSPLALIINFILKRWTSFEEMIVLPFRTYCNIPLLFPLLFIIGTFFICFVSTILPILMSKKVALKKELSDE